MPSNASNAEPSASTAPPSAKCPSAMRGSVASDKTNETWVSASGETEVFDMPRPMPESAQ